MSLALTAEQRDFAASVRKVLAAADGGHSEEDVVPGESWAGIEQQIGLMSIAVPEARGGAGGSWLDVAAAIEEYGARPVVGGVPLALGGLAGLLACPAADVDNVLAEVMSGESLVIASWLLSDRMWELTADNALVPTDRRLPDSMHSGPVGETFVASPSVDSIRLLLPVHAGDGLQVWLTAPVECGTETGAIDQTTASLKVPSGPVRASRVDCGNGLEVIARARAATCAMNAAEAVGSCMWLIRTGVEYLKAREQFGVVLASMQALKFSAADLFRRVEPLRSLAYAAASALDDPDCGQVDDLAVAAKIVADEVHPATALEVIQLHGGIGFTWELGLHVHYKRALMNRTFGGDDLLRRRYLARRIAARRTTMSGSAATGNDHAALRREAREWLAAHRDHAPPAGGAHDPMHYLPSPREVAWTDRCRDGGWLCLSWPEEYGGRGLDELEVIAVNEEFAAAGVPRPSLGMGETLLAPAILANGTPQQKSRLLPRILSGQDVYCQGFSEPEHGSDLAHIQTIGVVDGDQLVVNGSKIWQSGAHRANRVFLLCRTDPDAAAHSGISYVLADIPGNGVEVRPLRMMSGDFGFNQLHFADTHAALDDVIGGLNNGWRVAMTTLGAERAGGITSQYLGYLRELDLLIDELESVGRLEESAHELVPLWLEILQMKCNGRRVVELLRAGQSADDLLSIDKLNWSEYHVEFGQVAARLLGIHGILRPPGDGYLLSPLQRVMLESVGRRIARGTNQIQRRIVAERRLGMPR